MKCEIPLLRYTPFSKTNNELLKGSFSQQNLVISPFIETVKFRYLFYATRFMIFESLKAFVLGKVSSEKKVNTSQAFSS